MSLTRREFLGQTARGLAWIGLAGSAGATGWGAGCRSAGRTGRRDEEVTITILHTNDVHSRIDPFPKGSGRNAGKAGVVARARLIEEIRAELKAASKPAPLLVDAGDVFQGTPYFNKFTGEVDFRAMSLLGYDAMTIGNHEFDAGIDRLEEVASLVDREHEREPRFARFDLLSANYDFGDHPLARRVHPHVVREVGPARVGLFGLGVILEGLVSASLRPGVTYREPREVAREQAARLREEERCDLIVALSHLGDKGHAGEPGDQVLAREIEGIDLIVGGHSHTFMSAPSRIPHGERETLVHQVGFAGINLGRVEFVVKNGVVRSAAARSLPVSSA